jgi:hypothetical protein
LNVKLKIRPDIRYPALRLAGYPAKSVSGASLVARTRNILSYPILLIFLDPGLDW